MYGFRWFPTLYQIFRNTRWSQAITVFGNELAQIGSLSVSSFPFLKYHWKVSLSHLCKWLDSSCKASGTLVDWKCKWTPLRYGKRLFLTNGNVCQQIHKIPREHLMGIHRCHLVYCRRNHIVGGKISATLLSFETGFVTKTEWILDILVRKTKKWNLKLIINISLSLPCVIFMCQSVHVHLFHH